MNAGEQKVIDAEVISESIEGSGASASLARVEKEDGIQVDPEEMAAFGLIVPAIDPKKIRAAFQIKQQLYTAILDPHTDFLYTCSFKEPSGQTREYRTTSYVEIQKVAGTYKVPFKAAPKKSGISKLASALQIDARRVKCVGLPDDPKATFSHVEYEATHVKTGRKATGIGWCDENEKKGNFSMPKHHVIATADTRAFNRAVLRLAGYGDVSAEEIQAISDGEDGEPVIVDHGSLPAGAQPAKPAKERPPLTSDAVMTAARTWAEQIAARREGDRFAPLPTQEKNGWQEMRARARRGDSDAAMRLGKQGIHWHGIARDASGYEAFDVEPSPVTPEQMLAAHTGNAPPPETKKPTEAPAATKPAEAPAATTQPTPHQPSPDTGTGPLVPSNLHQDDVIIGAQAAELSAAVMAHFAGDKEKARAWLRKASGVDRSTMVRNDQFERLMTLIREGRS